MNRLDNLDAQTRERIERRYILVKKLGGGGQGDTYLAKSRDFEQKFAIKVVRSRDSRFSIDERSQRRFLSESAALAELIGVPGVPRYQEHVTSGDGNEHLPYLVQEFIDGPTLEKALDGRLPLPISEAFEITLQLFETLNLAHERGNIHRDIKPGNIILTNSEERKVYLVDWGLTFDKQSSINDTTGISEKISNRFFSLPECVIPGRANKRSPVIDVTLACGIFFYLLTGKEPSGLSYLRDERPDLVHQGLLRESSGLAYSSVKQFFDVAFQYDPLDRFQDAAYATNRVKRLASIAKEFPEALSLDLLDEEEGIFQRANNAEYRLKEIEQREAESSLELRKRLKQLCENKRKNFSLDFGTASFGNAHYEGYRAVRNSVMKITLKSPASRIECHCQYFLAIQGIEIVLCFQDRASEKSPRVNFDMTGSKVLEVCHYNEFSLTVSQELEAHFLDWVRKHLEKMREQPIVS